MTPGTADFSFYANYRDVGHDTSLIIKNFGVAQGGAAQRSGVTAPEVKYPPGGQLEMFAGMVLQI